MGNVAPVPEYSMDCSGVTPRAVAAASRTDFESCALVITPSNRAMPAAGRQLRRHEDTKSLSSRLRVVIAIVFLQPDRRVEQLAEPRGGQHRLLRPAGGDPSLAEQNHAVDLRHDLLDVMRDQNQRGAFT